MNAGIVRQSFNRAAATYTAAAALQQQVAAQLIATMQTCLPDGFSGQVLDAGCGTGDCLKQLHALYPDATIFGVDFAESMLHQLPASNQICRLNADLQHLPLADARIDLYVSSLAWQWCDVATAIQEVIRVLKPGGQLWLTTLVAGTFHELGAALTEAGLSSASHLLTLPPQADILPALAASGMSLITTHCDRMTTWHPDFATLRHSIRGVGANRLPTASHEPLNRAARQRLLAAYEARRTPQGLPLTYHVLTIHAQRS